MADANLSPRQKMINLMYLVFIAMLALNMSKEVLNAFGIINEKLVEDNVSLDAKNNISIEVLKQKALESPAQFSNIWDKAQLVSEASKSLNDYLENLKKSLLKTVDDSGDYTAMDNSSSFDERFFVGSQERKKFYESMETYRNTLLAVISDSYPRLVKKFSEEFDITRKIEDREGVKKTYMDYHFMGFPLISTVTKLSFIQSNVISYENEILTGFLAGQLTRIASMDNYTTLLEMEKTAFYPGEIFRGAVVLGRKDATTKPNKVTLSLGGKKLSPSEISIEEGKVKLKVKVSAPGDYALTGNLVFLEKGKEILVPVKSYITVIRKPSEAVISADKMNVVYRGVDNPITVSLPGVAANKLKVSALGLVKDGTFYIMRPGKGRTVEVKVSARLDGNVVVNSTKTFRIKDIPRPTGTVSGQPEKIRLPIENIQIATIGAMLEDFDFDIKLSVNSFKLNVPGQPSVTVSGNRLDERAKRVVRRARKGDFIQIFDVNASIVGNSTYKLKKVSGVTVEVQ